MEKHHINMRELVVSLLDEEGADRFGLWAFGEGFRELCSGSDYLSAWNKLHSSVLQIKPEGMIYQDIGKMILLWREQSLNE